MPSCPATSAKFQSAQAELGRQWNTQNPSQPNPGILRADESPCMIGVKTLLNQTTRYVYNRPCDKSEDGGGCLSDFWKRRAERSAAVAHGIGRMRRVDVEAAGLECLRAASSYLGEKRFVFGAKPTRLDFVLFGYVDSIAGATEEHQVYHRAVRAGELGNLWSHRRRMKERIGR